MRTLTYQEMMFVAGAKQEASEPPPKTEVSTGPTEEEVFVATANCAAAVWAARRSPTVGRTTVAIEICTDAAMKVTEYLDRKVRRK